MKIVGEALTFDDVLLLPGYSQTLPSQVQLQTQLTHLRSLCDNPTAGKDCGILHNLATTEGLPGKNLGSHGGGCH